MISLENLKSITRKYKLPGRTIPKNKHEFGEFIANSKITLSTKRNILKDLGFSNLSKLTKKDIDNMLKNIGEKSKPIITTEQEKPRGVEPLISLEKLKSITKKYKLSGRSLPKNKHEFGVFIANSKIGLSTKRDILKDLGYTNLSKLNKNDINKILKNIGVKPTIKPKKKPIKKEIIKEKKGDPFEGRIIGAEDDNIVDDDDDDEEEKKRKEVKAKEVEDSIKRLPTYIKTDEYTARIMASHNNYRKVRYVYNSGAPIIETETDFKFLDYYSKPGQEINYQDSFYNRLVRAEKYEHKETKKKVKYVAKNYILFFIEKASNKTRFVTITTNQLFTPGEFEKTILDLMAGEYVIGSDRVSDDEYELNTSSFDVIYHMEHPIRVACYTGEQSIYNIKGFKKYCLYKTLKYKQREYDFKINIKDFKKRENLTKFFHSSKYSQFIKTYIKNVFYLSSKYMEEGYRKENFKREKIKGRTVYISKENINKYVKCIKHHPIAGTDEELSYNTDLIGRPVVFNNHIDIIDNIKDLYMSYDLKIYYKKEDKYILLGDKSKLEITGSCKTGLLHADYKADTAYIVFDYETVSDYNDQNINKPYSLAYCTINKTDMELMKLKKYPKSKRVNYVEGFDCTKHLYNYIKERENDGMRFYFVSFNGANFDNFILYRELKKIDPECVKSPFYQGNSLLNFTIDGVHTMFDLRKHLTGSLKDNCDSYKIGDNSKKEFDHALAQEWYNKGVLFEKLPSTNIVEYNRYDVISTAILFYKYVTIMDKNLKEYGLPPTVTNPTIGGMIYKIIIKHWEDNHIKIPIFYNKKSEIKKTVDNKKLMEIYDEILKYKTAGRVQLINGKKHIEGDNVYSMDVCSEYPYIMAVKGCLFSAGEIKTTNKYIPNKIGFYYCDIDQRILKNEHGDMMKILGVKRPSKSSKSSLINDWDNNEKLEKIYISTVKINQLKKYGAKCTLSKDEKGETLGGIYFTETISGSKLFEPILNFMKVKNDMDTLKAQKDERYNPALRETMKLLMNSVSGKLIEGLHLTKIMELSGGNVAKMEKKSTIGLDVIDVDNNNLTVRLKKEQKNEMRKSRPIYLGVLIYDYAQEYMYDHIFSKIPREHQLYTDTDSCKITGEGLEIWKKHALNTIVPHSKLAATYDNRLETHKLYNEKSKVFGSFEDEYEEFHNKENKTSHYFIGKKCYLALAKNLNGEIKSMKCSFKGVKPKNDKLVYENENGLYVKSGTDMMKIADKTYKKSRKKIKEEYEYVNNQKLATIFNNADSMEKAGNIEELFKSLMYGEDRRIFSQQFKRNVRGTKPNIMSDNKYDNEKLNKKLINTIQIINTVKNIKA